MVEMREDMLDIYNAMLPSYFWTLAIILVMASMACTCAVTADPSPSFEPGTSDTILVEPG